MSYSERTSPKASAVFRPGLRQQQQHLESPQWYEDKCRTLLQDSLRTVGETNDIAQRTAEQLNCQTEQLGRIEHDADDVAHNLDTSQYLIKGMKSWWGSVIQMFTSPPTRQSASTTYDADRCPGGVDGLNTAINSSHMERAQDTLATAARASAAASSGIHGTSHLAPTTARRQETPARVFEAEMNQDLDKLSGMLTELHSKAVEMGGTISKHNITLDSIQEKVDRNTLRIDQQKKDIDKLLKR